jgi:hypothetical protein
MEQNKVTQMGMGKALEVNGHTETDLFESTPVTCSFYGLLQTGFKVNTKTAFPNIFNEIKLEACTMDILIKGNVVLEI